MRSGSGLDVRVAARALLASPAISIPAILTLGLAIGANTAVFSVVNAVLLRELPVADPHRLFSVSSDFAASRGFRAGAGWSYPMWEALRERSARFGGALAWHAARFTVRGPDWAESIAGVHVSGEFFTTLGVPAVHGRVFASGDDRPGGPPVAVISHRFWMRRFAGAPGIIGSPITVGRTPFTIIGVTPASFQGIEVGQPFDLAVPINAGPLIGGAAADVFAPRRFLLLVMLRLRAGQTPADATTSLRAIQSEIVPAAVPAFVREPFTLVSAAGGTSGPTSAQQVYRDPLLLMLAWVALVLVIACVNVANLLLAKAATRHGELAVRAALGATRSRLARPLVLEALLLALAGGAIGLLLAAWAAGILLSLVPYELESNLDLRVAGFAILVTGLAALLSGTGPAYRAARFPAVRSMAGPVVSGRGHLSGILVALQIALAMVLVTTAVLLVLTFKRLAAVPLGFDANRVLVVSVGTTSSSGFRAAPADLPGRLTDAVARVPGVMGAAASVWTPLSGSGGLSTMPVTGSADEVAVLSNFVTPEWFSVYGTPLRAGRDLSVQDTRTGPPVVVVNDAFVRRFLPDGSAVGRTISGGRLIVGVVGDAVYRASQRIPGVASLALREAVPPTIYAPLAQLPDEGPQLDTIRLSIRTAGGTSLVGPAIGAAINSVDPTLTFEIRPLSDHVRQALAQERLSAAVSTCFGLLSLVLCGLGLYGVTAHGVSRRGREIGLRMALGARRSDVLRSVLGVTLTTTMAGIIVGLGACLLTRRVLASMLFGIAPLDPIALAAVTLLLVSVAVAAALPPAMRACRIDPGAMIRHK